MANYVLIVLFWRSEQPTIARQKGTQARRMMAEPRTECEQPLYQSADLRAGNSLIRRAMKIETYRALRGTTLIDGAVSEVLELHTGWACRVRYLSDGRRVIVGLYLPGELIGLEGIFGATSQNDTVVSLSAVTYRAVEREKLVRLMERREIALCLGNHLMLERQRLESVVVNIGFKGAEERLAAFLLDLYRRLDRLGLVSAGSYALPMTQAEIGAHLALTAVHLNRVLRRLREAGAIRLAKRMAVVDDLPRLRALAAEETAFPAASPIGDKEPEGSHQPPPPGASRNSAAG
jgi:CRP-like cAMP-binding protein